MNYKSQLKGWAVDRVIELWKATGGKYGEGSPMECLKNQADELAEYCYDPDKDLKSTTATLVELIGKSEEPLEIVNQLIQELMVRQEELMRFKPANAEQKGAIQ